jgi:hypothetical protein
MADWVTISSLATAGGTLVLAVATFSSVKSGTRSARLAERSLLAGVQPVLIPSREDDAPERIRFGDGQVLRVSGHGGALELAEENGNLYMAIALRNGGAGLAVIHGWRIEAQGDSRLEALRAGRFEAPEADSFRRQQRDLYIPAGYTGFWQGAIRDRQDADYASVRSAAESREPVLVDLMYGDHEGGQRTIARFTISPWEELDGERADVVRYWNVDRDDPRER